MARPVYQIQTSMTETSANWTNTRY